MPPEQPIRREGLTVVARCIEHHFDDAFYIAVRRLQARDINPQAAGDGRADLLSVELFTFDFAGLDHVSGERLEYGFLAELKPESFHVPDETPLLATDRGKRFSQTLPIPVVSRPIWELVGILDFYAFHA